MLLDLHTLHVLNHDLRVDALGDLHVLDACTASTPMSIS